MSPAPDESFARAQRHVHSGAAVGIAVAGHLPLEDINGGLPLIPSAAIRLQDSLGMGALDEIVVPHEVLLAGNRLVVAQ